MNDVRSLVQAIGQIGSFGLIVFVAYVLFAFFLGKRDGRAALARTFVGGGGLTIILVIVTGVLTYTSFDSLFLTFHELAFRNNYWELNPRTDHLIQMFPFGFWYDAILTLALRVVIIAGLLSVIGIFIGRLDRRHA